MRPSTPHPGGAGDLALGSWAHRARSACTPLAVRGQKRSWYEAPTTSVGTDPDWHTGVNVNSTSTARPGGIPSVLVPLGVNLMAMLLPITTGCVLQGGACNTPPVVIGNSIAIRFNPNGTSTEGIPPGRAVDVELTFTPVCQSGSRSEE